MYEEMAVTNASIVQNQISHELNKCKTLLQIYITQIE